MKKYLSLFFCILLVMLSCVTASAAQVVKFDINLVSETDTEAVITFDYEGGVSFSGLDFEIDVNTDKIRITESKAGEGYKNFLLQGNTAIFQCNSDKNPAMVTMACVPGFRVVDGKDLFTFKIKKLTADAIETDDFVVTITNCTDGNFNQLTPSVTTDLKVSVSQPTSSVADNTTEASTDASSTTEVPEFTNGTAPDSEFEEIETEQTENDGEADDKGNKTGFVIAGVVGVIIVAGIGTAVVLMRKKKTEANDVEKGNDDGIVQ